MAAEFEKVLGNANVVDLQYLPPYSRDFPLLVGAWR